MPNEFKLTTDTGFEVVARGFDIPPPTNEEPVEMTEIVTLLDIEGSVPIASLRVLQSNERRDHLWIVDLKVDENFQDKGLDRLLFQECFNTARHAGYTHLFVVVYTQKEQAFYRSRDGIIESAASGFTIYSWGL